MGLNTTRNIIDKLIKRIIEEAGPLTAEQKFHIRGRMAQLAVECLTDSNKADLAIKAYDKYIQERMNRDYMTALSRLKMRQNAP